MILFQSFKELGEPTWTLIGSYYKTFRCAVDQQGYGQGHEATFLKAKNEFLDKFGNKVHLVGSKIERVYPAYTHSSYQQLDFIISGDLYEEKS